MKNFFLDTNVVIDMLANREPFAQSAAQLFDLAEKGKIRLYVSALSYSNIYYIIKKGLSHKQLVGILQDLEALAETLSVSKQVIADALHSNFKDFEDAIQYHTAISGKKVDALVTRDTKDYRQSTISVLTPEEAIRIALL